MYMTTATSADPVSILYKQFLNLLFALNMAGKCIAIHSYR